ncbi:MAG: DUF6178 family protein [Desulfomonilaceae bacterium]|jgi:hypothetical protein
MENYGLVTHDDQSFLAKVVQLGIQRGELSRDRADEIVRMSVAMANKYVLQKEIDFRSVEQLAKVQQTVLKLVGVGLEIKSEGDADEGVYHLRERSPVDLFRLAYTRTESLRTEWKKLLLHDRVQILVNRKEYECLSEIACQLLSKMSVFTEGELYVIKTMTLEDDLFTSLSVLEYYESELRRYKFILELKDALPFSMLNRSSIVRAENLSEVDSIREALINTLVISAHLETDSPVVISSNDIREFLESIDWNSTEDPFPVELEPTVIDVIHELGHGMKEEDASFLAKEIINTIQKLVNTIINDWNSVNSLSTQVFFKRWARITILSDKMDELDHLFSTSGSLDEFEFESLMDMLSKSPGADVSIVIERLPWETLSPNQVIRLFQDLRSHQKELGMHVSLKEFTGPELIDLLESMDGTTIDLMFPKIKECIGNLSLELEDLEILASLHETDSIRLMRVAGPPHLDKGHALVEFRDGSHKMRQILFNSCIRADFFPDLFVEAWNIDPQFVKREVKTLATEEIGPFLKSIAGGTPPTVSKNENNEFVLRFGVGELTSFYNSLPLTKRRAALRYFTHPKKLAEF